MEQILRTISDSLFELIEQMKKIEKQNEKILIRIEKNK